jgi:hypothetical protein
LFIFLCHARLLYERRWAKLRAEPGMDDVLGNVEVEEVVMIFLVLLRQVEKEL